MLAQLLLMPGKQHVFLAVLAGVAHQRKGQRILVRPAKLINATPIAILWGFAAGALNGNRIAGDRVSSPDITFAIMISIDIKRAVGLHRPDGAK